MSALGQMQTSAHVRVMSALPQKRTLLERVGSWPAAKMKSYVLVGSSTFDLGKLVDRAG
jgi:hypothetical protein